MGVMLSSILPCCVKNREEGEEESNPTQRLIDETSRPSYMSEARNIPDSQTRSLTENSTTSTKSIYYTPTSSFKDTSLTSV